MNSQMTTTTISSANQTAVPSNVRKKMNIKAGDKIVWQIGNDGVTIKILPSDWGSYMKGLGKEVWKGVDVKKYIEDGRKNRSF